MMAARGGMDNLISEVRRMTHAGTADHTVAGVAYWTDDQIQERLDRTRQTVKRVSLSSDPEYVAGDNVYLEYKIPVYLKWLEEDDTDSGWALRDGDGADATGYTVNYQSGVITFGTDQDSEIYYLDARAYDVYAAAGDMWESKAGFYEASVDWSSDNHRVSKSQMVKHAMAMANKYKGMGPSAMSFTRRVRVDERRR